MLTQLIGKEETRAVMHMVAARFAPLPNTIEDKFVKHEPVQVGTTYTTLVKHDKTETVLIVEKTESGIIRVASDAGENHSEMMQIGLTQLEAIMPVVVVKKKLKKPKAKAKVIAEMAAKAELDVGGLSVKQTAKPRKRKVKKE